MNSLIGIGAGPGNLSIAALARNIPDLDVRLLEARSSSAWHSGLLFEQTGLQVSFLKDLVTPVDPTNPFSFLNFLKDNRRLYQFINAAFEQTPCLEFDSYLRWVSGRLGCVTYGRTAQSVELEKDHLRIITDAGDTRTANVALGLGQQPKVPRVTEPHLGRTFFHAGEFRQRVESFEGQSIAIIGSGQSGTEVFLETISGRFGMPQRVNWISRTSRFMPLDETALTNEMFTPGFVNYFFDLPPAQRQKMNAEMHFTSNGISPLSMRKLYQTLYTMRFLDRNEPKTALIPGHDLKAVIRNGSGWALTLKDRQQGEEKTARADCVILCTGYEARPPDCIAPLIPELARDHQGPLINKDYSLVWTRPRRPKLFVVNAAKNPRKTRPQP
ncbi:MAG: SidA/IucD/PvdA family monooxygenase [Hyphomicrobiales bacterium]